MKTFDGFTFRQRLHIIVYINVHWLCETSSINNHTFYVYVSEREPLIDQAFST